MNNKSLKLLKKNLEGVILEEIFYKKNQEINQELNLLKSKLYSLQESNGKSFTKEGIEFILHNLKNRFNEKIDRSIIELFVKDIKIFPDNVIVTLRKLPKLHKSGDPKRTLKIKTYFCIYSFGYKMSYEDFKKANNIIEEKIKEHKNYIKKENQDKKAIVGYNGIDGKEVTMSKFKEDINEIRDSRSRYGREVEK